MMDDKGLPFWYETPARREGHHSVFKLPELLALAARKGVFIIKIWQCNYGARTAKPTDIMHNGLELEDRGPCQHEQLWWRMPWSGQWHYGAHPLLTGTQWMIPATSFERYMLR